MIDKGQLQVDGVFKVEINVGLQFDGYQKIPDLVHERSELVLALNLPARHVHAFSTTNLNVVDLLTKNVVLQTTPLVQIRIGLSRSDGMFWFPWQKHILLNVNSEPTGKGYQITFTTGDMLEAMSRQYKTRFHRGTLKEIIERIATENGLQSVIEPTLGSWSYVQSNQTDGEFIEKLSGRAVNESGRGGFRYYVQDNVLHFHTLDYVATLRTANIFSLAGTVTNLTTRVRDAVDEGATGVEIVGIDPYEGRAYSLFSDPNKVVIHGNQTPDLKPLGPLVVARHPSWNRTDELKAISQSMYDSAHVSLMGCTAYIEKGYPIQMNDLIRVVYQSSSAQQSPWGGLYSVASVTHTVEKGVANSVIRMERGEFQVSNLDKTTADGAINTSDFVADGQPINLSSVVASLETKGPPDSFTGGRYVKTVQAV